MPWKETNVMDQKIEFVFKSLTQEYTFTDLCKQYAITPKTGYKWQAKFLKDGIKGLNETSRTPHNNKNQISENIVCDLVRIKTLKKSWGPKKIRKVYELAHQNQKIPSLSTVERILKKAGLVTRKKRRKQREVNRIQNRSTPLSPNDVWTVDFKGWWYTPFKEKCEPLTVCDEFSKYILSIKILEKGDISCVKHEFEQIFKMFGLPKVIKSDNGPPFANSHSIFGLTKLAVWWLSLGIILDRIDPGSPYQNGSHERMHLNIKRELEGKVNGNLIDHQAIFDVWRNEYNNERPHESLGMKTPSQVYVKSKLKFSGDDEIIDYPKDFKSRQVNDRGYINYSDQRVFISNAFNGYNVGLTPKDKDTVSVWFDNNLIGEINKNDFVFKSSLTILKKQIK
jgi:transposase InsO family protein